MARIRTIKPEFFLHESLAELSTTHRLLFIGLWTLADREGRLEDRPKRIKAALFPYEEVDVDKLLADLANHRERFIIRYRVKGRSYIAIPAFNKHQRPHPREAESVLPAPRETRTSREKAMPNREKDISNKADKGKEVLDKGKEMDSGEQEGEFEGKPRNNKSAGSASALGKAKASPATHNSSRLMRTVTNASLCDLYKKHGFDGMKQKLSEHGCSSRDIERLTEADIRRATQDETG